MITFRQISCESDCTGPYVVNISKSMTVKNFIDELLEKYPYEWGYIGIYKNGTYFGEPHCEYKRGKLLYSLPNEYLNRQIKSVDGSGGWYRSDFILHIV